jgi:hypothetical protein
VARFNLADYETVEERIKRFYGDYPDGRILTDNETIPEYRAEKIWVVRALVFLNGEDVERGCPKASGLAYEVDSASGPQAASALEVCETSAIGRALANAGYSGNKRASREEMEKVQRHEQAKTVARDWLAEALTATHPDSVRVLWGEASKQGAPQEVLDRIAEHGKSLTPVSEREGAVSSVPGGSKSKRSTTR